MNIQNIDITKHIIGENVVLGLKAKSKKNIISSILDHLIKIKKIRKDDKKIILKLLLQREEMGSTAIGGGVALPHVRTENTKNIVMCMVISKEGFEFNSLDQALVHIVVMLISPQNEAGIHLKMLARLARILKDKYFVQQLIASQNSDEALKLFYRQQFLIK